MVIQQDKPSKEMKSAQTETNQDGSGVIWLHFKKAAAGQKRPQVHRKDHNIQLSF